MNFLGILRAKLARVEGGSGPSNIDSRCFRSEKLHASCASWGLRSQSHASGYSVHGRNVLAWWGMRSQEQATGHDTTLNPKP